MNSAQGDNDRTGNLIWIDLEMTGLNTESDTIIEIATIVTDRHLNELAQGPELAIGHPKAVMDAMDDWNRRQHRKSGLTERVKASTITESEAEERTLAFLQDWVSENASPMCGNSICQDRRFLHRCMPRLEKYFHYRNLDVSSVKELAARWAPKLLSGLEKQSSHLALADVHDSIKELRYWREHFFKV